MLPKISIRRASFHVLVILLAACSSAKTIDVKRLVPGSVPIGNIQTLGIASFESSQKAEDVAASLVGKLEQGVANSGHLKMFTRNPEEMRRVVKELEEHGGKGTLRSRDLDRFLGEGLEGIIFGRITAATITDDRSFEDIRVTDASSGAERTIRQTYKLRTGNLSVNFKVLDAKTGQVIVAQSANATATWQALESGDPSLWRPESSSSSSSGSIGTSLDNMLGTGAKPVAAKVAAIPVRALPADAAVFDQLATESAMLFLEKIQPHFETGTIALQGSSNPMVRKGLELACHCDFEEADQSIQDGIAAGPDITAADHFNLGIVKYVRGCNREAIDSLKRAADAEPENSTFVQAYSVAKKGGTLEAVMQRSSFSTRCPQPCEIKVACGTEPVAAPAPLPRTRCVTVDSMTLRASGNRDSKAIKTIPKETEITVDDDGSNPSWSKVHAELNGKSYDGWGFKKSYECTTE